MEPGHAALLLHRAALLDTAPVEDHEGGNEVAVFDAPPAWRSIAASLLFKGASRRAQAGRATLTAAHAW